MIVHYFGNGCFRLQSGDTSLLVDPENNRLKADVVLRTLVPANAPLGENAPDGAAEFSFPGEYELKGMDIVGFPVSNESTAESVKTAFIVRWEEMKFVFLGHLAAPLDATLMEECIEPDVLFLPIGGGTFLEPEVAAKVAKQLEARIIIPSFFKNAADFLKAFGKKGEEAEKFVFKQKDIATDKGRVVVIKQS